MNATPGQAATIPQQTGQRLLHLASDRRFAVALALCLTILMVCVVNRSFASFQNFRDLLVQSAPVVIVGSGMTLIVITGEIDISVGSLYGFLAALMGVLASPQHQNLSASFVVGVTLTVGALIGLLNGLLVTLGRVPSIVATLGMLTILRGVTEVLLGGAWITDLPPAIRSLGLRTFMGFPYCIWAAMLITAATTLILVRSPLGIRLFAIGGNSEAAAIARISITRTKVYAFTLVGVLTALAVLLCVPQQSVIESGLGAGFELVVVTAVVVGGTSIRGGRGAITGTLLAALLLGSIRTALLFLNLGELATYWERAIQGVFILTAVLADHLGASRSAQQSQQGRAA